MATKAYLIPRTDTGLRDLGALIASVIGDQGSLYSLSPAQVTAFLLANGNYDTALTACVKAVRIPSAVTTKNHMRALLETQIKLLNNYVNGIPTVTDAMKQNLGFPIRKRPSPIPAPSTVPQVHVAGVIGRTVTIELHGTTAGKRAKPSGVATASVFTAAATADGNPPTDMAAWSFYSSTGRTSLDVDFGASPTAGTVYVTAFWANAKGDSGPSAAPLRIELPASQPVPSTAKMRIAA